MKIKMLTVSGDDIFIDSSEVTNFSPRHVNSKDFTAIETVDDLGKTQEIIVQHEFYRVCEALTLAWERDEKPRNGDHVGEEGV